MKTIFLSRRFLQTTNERILLYYYETSGWLVFVRFWRKLKTPKRHFEINWPLIVKNFTCDSIWSENPLYWACCSIVLKHATSWWIWKKSCLFAFLSFWLSRGNPHFIETFQNWVNWGLLWCWNWKWHFRLEFSRY